MDLSLITSLFRSEAHLPLYGQRVTRAVAALRRAGLSSELVLVANGSSAEERRAIESLAAAVRQAGASVIIQYVARETVYASWNRGVRVSSGACIGFWNADDLRYAAALVEGVRRMRAGCQLVDFPFVQITQGKAFGLLPVTRTRTFPPQYDPAVLTRKQRLGPFFLFARTMYETAGPFDEHFRISGDFEWGERDAVRTARICYGQETGGEFVLHGGNLSGGHDDLETIEDNIVFLRHGVSDFEQLRPVRDTGAMRRAWESWGNAEGVPVPPEVEADLWGENARQVWRDWRRRAVLRRLEDRVRSGPRWLIDHTGLRPILARLHIVTPK